MRGGGGVDAVKKASARAAGSGRREGQGGSGCFSACVVVVSPSPAAAAGGERGGQFTPARTAPKPHLCGRCFACVRERAVRISPACLGLLAAPPPLALACAVRWGLPPAPPAAPGCLLLLATTHGHPHTALLGTAEAPPASPVFRATLRRNRGCGMRWILTICSTYFGFVHRVPFLPPRSGPFFSRDARAFASALWAPGVGNVAADGLCVKKEECFPVPLVAFMACCTGARWRGAAAWASASFFFPLPWGELRIIIVGRRELTGDGLFFRFSASRSEGRSGEKRRQGRF